MRAPILVVIASLVAAGCGGTPAQAPEPNVPEPVAPPEANAADPSESSPSIDTAELERLTTEEAKTGECHAEHQAALEKLLEEVETNVRQKTEDDKPISIESFTKRTLALSDAARGIQLQLSGRGTQVHVIAWSPNGVSLDVLAGNQAATTMRSAYQRDVTNGPAQIALPKIGDAVPLESDSRQIEMTPGMPLDVRMRGQGCAAVVVFSKS